MRIAAFATVLLICLGAPSCSEVSSEERLEAVRSAIAGRNFGEAAETARLAVSENPQDPTAHYELARAEALLGNEGAAIAALGKAVELGLPNAAAAFADPAFDALRAGKWFAELGESASPRAASKRSAGRDDFDLPAGFEPESRIGAGQGRDRVEILEGEGRTIIRAGDVVLDADF